MYPFYPLGTFIQIEGDKNYKYPKILVLTNENPEGVYNEIPLEENQYYRDMNDTEKVHWYKCIKDENGNLILDDKIENIKEQNNLINLRKKLEININNTGIGTLSKKWLFGSAIQYTPNEYNKC
jgi:hypothetical protein